MSVKIKKIIKYFCLIIVILLSAYILYNFGIYVGRLLYNYF